MPGPGKLTAALQRNLPAAKQQILAHLSPAVAHFADVVVDHGQGSYIWDTEDNKYLDFGAGIGTLSIGHCHPQMVDAIKKQSEKIIQGQQNQYLASTAMVGLLDRLTRIMPEELTRFLFVNSGSEAVENAVKIARRHTGRQNIIAFDGGYHGRTYAAMALTTSKNVYRAGYGPLMSGVVTAPYPDCLHCKVRLAHPEGNDWYKLEPNIPPYRPYADRKCCRGPEEGLEWLFKTHTAASETAAVIIEPILGEGGFLSPPPTFLQTVRKICDDNGILMILDEVQSGVGRTGRWWAHEHFPGAEPDMVLFAKGIASGFPFAGVATKEHLMDNCPPGSLGGTFGGNALGCAAASAVVDVIEDEELLQNAASRGTQLAEGLVALADAYPIIDVRGRGLMMAVEFGSGPEFETVRRATEKEVPYGTASQVVAAAGRRGLLLLTAGSRETVRFLPPLNVRPEEVDEALAKFEEALDEVFNRSKA